VPQTTLSVVLEVAPDSTQVLIGIVEKVKANPGEEELYSRLKSQVPVLHFMSMTVFEGADYDPIFVVEANFDGAPGPFWAQLEAALGERLRLMLRCCKRPADSSGPLYDAVTAVGSSYPIAPYLERKTLTPSVFFHGNRGLDRARILAEHDLFLATRPELEQADPERPNPYRRMKTAADIHAALRRALLPAFGWLAGPGPPRIARRERAADIARLFGFVLAVLFVLSVPGMLLAQATTGWEFVVLIAAAFAVTLAGLWKIHAPRRGEAAPRRRGGLTRASLSSESPRLSAANPVGLAFWVIVFIAVHVAAAFIVILCASWALSAMTLIAPRGFEQAWWPILRAVLLGLFSLPFVIAGIVLWLRWLERRDSSHDAPAVDARELRKMRRLEDWFPQNHMGSVVLVKPGILRMALFRTGHLGLGLLLRVVATDGYLGSMRTVHFAHWAFVSNGSRLMFFSNFDHSWDSYLDDFIEKAHGGLTLAWGSGIGFPPTRFLVLDGASHGRQFKGWARHSMAVSRFWFSAYKHLTVDQIERNTRIAAGLRKPELTATEAAAWARDL
jgi:hypothetical protein